MRGWILAGMIGAVCAATAAPAVAHHGVEGEFDTSRAVTLKGVVERVDWINPHIYFTLAVARPDGSVERWQLESVPVAFARTAGLTKESMMGGGKPVEVTAYLGRATGRERYAFAKIVKFADGHINQFARDY